MRILHTADWHLGHTLHDLGREYEHERFLAWLLDTLAGEKIDALIVAGDIFDNANPPAAAQRMLYHFVSDARTRLPALEILIIGGNHDSAERLDAPTPLFRALNVRVVGGVPKRDGEVDYERMVVPLRDASGQVRAVVAAVPYARPADLPALDEAEEPALVAGVRALYRNALDAARRTRKSEQALIATGHCYMANGTISELSERKIQCGNQQALPCDIFPDDVAYAALGHLHRPQHVGANGKVCYSGAPIPLSMSEAAYPQVVRIVEFDGKDAAVRTLEVPRAVELLRVPEKPRELKDVLAELEVLPPRRPDQPDEQRPFLEVQVLLTQYEPGLRRQVEEALKGKAARMVKLSVEYTGHGGTLAEAMPKRDLAGLRPEDVFIECYKRSHTQDPPQEWLVEFRGLVEKAQDAEGPRA